MAKPQAPERHYDTEALVEEYRKTFGVFIAALFICVAGALVYFFVFVVYLGGWSHTKGEDFVKDFGSRIEYEYHGTKLPQFGGPAEPEPAKH
jgi:hypothetical protein